MKRDTKGRPAKPAKPAKTRTKAKPDQATIDTGLIQAAIDAEIVALTKIKPTVRRTSQFGDNHHDAIDAQIKVLDQRMNRTEADDYFEFDPENVQDAVRDAVDWLRGEFTGAASLAESWRELVR